MIIWFKEGDEITYTNLQGETNVAKVLKVGNRRIRIEQSYLQDGKLVVERKFVKPENCVKLPS